jgi:hypothetical protein
MGSFAHRWHSVVAEGRTTSGSFYRYRYKNKKFQEINLVTMIFQKKIQSSFSLRDILSLQVVLTNDSKAKNQQQEPSPVLAYNY